MEDKGGRQRAWEGGADYSVQGTTGRVTNKHGRKGDQRAWEGGEQTIVSVRIRTGNKREAGQCTGGGRWADYSLHKDKVKKQTERRTMDRGGRWADYSVHKDNVRE